MLTDIEIAQQTKMRPIKELLINDFGICEYEPYGHYKAKVRYDHYGSKNGKVILVTAMNPTPMGEGKTTMSIGLADGLSRLGKSTMLALREPSLGPVFGVKGGAAGGGYAQVVPMEDINLHFTGDLHAIENANNLLAAMIDNHIYQGNELGIHKVVWRRCMDMNDRQLRNITCGFGNKIDGVPRADGFDITVASEVMAIFCLATSLDDLKERLGNIIIGYNVDDEPIYAKDLKAHGAMTALLKDAFNPNIVQTLEGTPAVIHGGPFANIAHGCNSIVATKWAKSWADYVVTEAGFGADLGAEKFLDIKCPAADITPGAIVIVATTKAIKYNGGVPKDKVKEPNMDALEVGIANLHHHVLNMKNYMVPVVVVINKYDTDTNEEIDYIKRHCGTRCAVCTAHADGGAGAIEFAQAVLEAMSENPVDMLHPYDIRPSTTDLCTKMTDLCRNIYNADSVEYTDKIIEKIHKIEEMGYGGLPICVAKTQYSFSDNPTLLGWPTGFQIKVRDVILCAGAGFVIFVCGNIMRMPGLPKHPAAENIDVVNGKIVGLF